MLNEQEQQVAQIALVAGIPSLCWATAATLTHTLQLPLHTKSLVAAIKASPDNPVLMGATIAGLAVGFAGAYAVKKLNETEFAGASFSRYLRGTQLVSSANLTRMTRNKKQQQVTVAGVPIPHEVEGRHLLICGSTGTGKTVAITEIITGLIKRRDRTVIVDPDGAMLSRFYFPGDIVLNPFDTRSPGWSIFNEIRNPYDYERISRSVIPVSDNKQQEEWNGYARSLFAETARKLKEMDKANINELLHWLLVAPVEDLKVLLSDTPAQGFFQEGAEKAFGSVRFILTQYLTPQKYVSAGDFSLRTWLESGKGNLYITWRDDMTASLRPLISAWADILCSAVLSLTPDPQRRISILLDELATLERLSSLEDAATKGRKYGLRLYAALQSTSQLDDKFGVHGATTIRSCFRSMLVLGGTRIDGKTAEDLSRALGEHEVERVQKSHSSSARGDSANHSSRPVRERVVIPAEIAGLPDLTGYLAFAGDWPIAKVRLKPRNYPVRVDAFDE